MLITLKIVNLRFGIIFLSIIKLSTSAIIKNVIFRFIIKVKYIIPNYII